MGTAIASLGAYRMMKARKRSRRSGDPGEKKEP